MSKEEYTVIARIPVRPKTTPEEKAKAKKEAKNAYMRDYMRVYHAEKRKDIYSYHRGPYVSKYDKIKMEAADKV